MAIRHGTVLTVLGEERTYGTVEIKLGIKCLIEGDREVICDKLISNESDKKTCIIWLKLGVLPIHSCQLV